MNLFFYPDDPEKFKSKFLNGQNVREFEIPQMSKSAGKFKFTEFCSEYRHFIHLLCYILILKHYEE